MKIYVYFKKIGFPDRILDLLINIECINSNVAIFWLQFICYPKNKSNVNKIYISIRVIHNTFCSNNKPVLKRFFFFFLSINRCHYKQ